MGIFWLIVDALQRIAQRRFSSSPFSLVSLSTDMAFPSKGLITIEDVELQWSIKRFGGVSNNNDAYRGLAVSVSLEPGRTKELVIEFPFEEYEFSPPKSKSVFLDRLRQVIDAAMEE